MAEASRAHMEHGTALNPAQRFGFEAAELRRRSQPLEETVAELYATMRTPLLGYACQVVGSTGEAEDLVQIAFLRLFDQLRSRAQIENLRSWLYRVVHNLAIDQLRRQGKQESAVTEWLAQRALEASETSAEEDLIRRQSIIHSLAILNVRERYCLILRAEGLSYKEIADVLSISSKAVSVYLTRGLKKFEVRHVRHS
jgi:RNA polymerase sigma-70 factor (ECF subfamily)